jgi:TP901 family phage tail tape measure protein
MAIRELLSEFGIGVDLSQVVAAEGALGRVQGLAARVAGSLGQVGGKALSVDVDSAPMAGLAQVTDFAKEALLSFFSVQGAQRLAGQFTEIIGEAGKLNDQSEKLGVSAEYLQRFSYAVGLSGVEGEGAAASLGKLSRVLGDAVGGGESAKVFRELGVEFQTADKKAKPLSDIVSQLADKVKGAGSEAEAAAFLTKAFGKQGAALIPAFKQGGEALERLGDELDDLGGLMSEDFVKAADDVGDDLDRIKVGVKGVGIQIASVALPYVSRLVAMLVKWAKSGAAVLKETNALKTATIALGTAGVGFLVLRLAQLARA